MKRTDNCWLGRKHTAESRLKMSISASKRIRKPFSLETRRKISDSNKGKHHSTETIRKISEARKGKPAPWMVGNKYQSGEKNVHYGKFGSNHPCWKKDKKRPFQIAIRSLFKYRQWRSDVFTKDDFTCQLCWVRGCELQADHYPKRFIDIIRECKIDTFDKAILCEKLWDINNGRTLCVDCHRKTDTWGRKN